MSHFRPPNRLVLLSFLPVSVALWSVPVFRSVRFCGHVAELSAAGGFYEDLRYAYSLRNGYLFAAAISLAYAITSVWLRSRLLLVLCCVQLLAPAYLIWDRPEELYAITPPLLASLVVGFCFWCFGGYLLCHVVYHLATPESEPCRLTTRPSEPPLRSSR